MKYKISNSDRKFITNNVLPNLRHPDEQTRPRFELSIFMNGDLFDHTPIINLGKLRMEPKIDRRTVEGITQGEKELAKWINKILSKYRKLNFEKLNKEVNKWINKKSVDRIELNYSCSVYEYQSMLLWEKNNCRSERRGKAKASTPALH